MKTEDYIALSEEVAKLYNESTWEYIDQEETAKLYQNWNVLMPLAIENGVYAYELDCLEGKYVEAARTNDVAGEGELYKDHNNSKDLATATALMRALIKVKS